MRNSKRELMNENRNIMHVAKTPHRRKNRTTPMPVECSSAAGAVAEFLRIDFRCVQLAVFLYLF
ncbi:MAG: hypothetical protein WBH50_22015 [Fuerstiella sp.]